MFEGQDLGSLSEAEIRDIRGKDIAMIFQDPMTSLNPVLTIEEQMVETIRAHRDGDRRRRPGPRHRAPGDGRHPASPETRLKDFPHQFSGGMRQRVMIAMALALEPKLLIADEPTTALDVTIQAQVLELLRSLTTERRDGASILITHDLGVVAGMTQRINVMYAGFVVEAATTDRPVRASVASLHGRAAALDPAPRRRRRRGADPDRGPAAGPAARADRLPVRARAAPGASTPAGRPTPRCCHWSRGPRS